MIGLDSLLGLNFPYQYCTRNVFFLSSVCERSTSALKSMIGVMVLECRLT